MNDYEKVWNYCAVYITLLITFLIIIFKLRRGNINNSINTCINTETLIYKHIINNNNINKHINGKY